MRQGLPEDDDDEGVSSEVLVLCYHAVSSAWPASVAVTPRALERQLTSFLRAGYRPATFADAVAGGAADKVLAVTFDDAYRSMFEQAYPILRALGIPATVFVPTAHGDGARSWSDIDSWLGGAWEGELAGATWDQLGELSGAGWEIGSHGRSHVRLPGLDDAALAQELEGSRSDCEARLGVRCRSIAYPYGDDDARVLAAAKAAGYEAGATVSGEQVTATGPPDPMRWPRLGVDRGDRALGLRVKAGLHRHPRAWNLVRRARRSRRPAT